jgi:hypothetical protein
VVLLPEHGSQKKRKLEASASQGVDVGVAGEVLFAYPETSFSVPVRKKLRLEGLGAGLRAVDLAGKVEASMSWEAIGIMPDFLA